LKLVRRLADEGKTILIIEHRVEDVLRIQPDLVLYLEDGRVKYQGSAQGLLDTADYRKVKLPAPIVIARSGELTTRYDDTIPPHANRDAKSLVEFKNVSFNYPEGPTVLNDVSLSIRQGDIIAVLGPNGAGKTTLVKHAIGLLRPTKGDVLLDGVDSKDMTVATMARTVGYIFQSPRHMSLRTSEYGIQRAGDNREHRTSIRGGQSFNRSRSFTAGTQFRTTETGQHSLHIGYA
jgi:energy-coupling factor transport system ATP-binding protein